MTQGTDGLPGPAACKRRLRRELRRFREAAKLTQEQAAHVLDWHLSKVLRIEAGTSGVSVTDLRALLAIYGANDPERTQTMIAWARRAKESVWWSPYRTMMPPAFRYYLGLEAEAASMRYYQDMFMPGLFQTEAYARAILTTAMAGLIDAEAINRRLDLRLRRQQEAFSRPDPLRVFAVLDEAVLRRHIGGPKVMRAELEHLLELTTRPYLNIRILPFITTERAYFGGAFTILEFDTDDDPVVYVESGAAGRTEDTMERVRDIAAHRTTFNMIAATAASHIESRRLIRESFELL